MKIPSPKNQSEKIAIGSLFFACLSHIPCCLFPLAIGLGLFSGVSVFAQFQPYFPLFSFVILFMAWLSFFKPSTESRVCCISHKKKASKQKKLLILLTFLSITFNIWGIVKAGEQNHHVHQFKVNTEY
ncbi:MAG: hypothetical protein QNJ31_01685 [Candidatus Caenarcaniphilales bacterium]|nr:hypothetical protein [Candidatus Caenarcaniphilales bacterium]